MYMYARGLNSGVWWKGDMLLTEVDRIYRSNVAAKCLHAECGHRVSDVAVIEASVSHEGSG